MKKLLLSIAFACFAFGIGCQSTPEVLKAEPLGTEIEVSEIDLRPQLPQNQVQASITLPEPQLKKEPETPSISPAPTKKAPAISLISDEEKMAGTNNNQAPPSNNIKPTPQPETSSSPVKESNTAKESLIPKSDSAAKNTSTPTKDPSTTILPQQVNNPVSLDNDKQVTSNQLSDRVRTIYARQGDEIEVSFQEKGWLLLEIPGEKSGLVFLGRDVGPSQTVFRFRSKSLGEFSLPFQYQDALQGIIRREIVQLKVVTDSDFNSYVGRKGSDYDPELYKQQMAKAERLAQLGYYKDALATYLALANVNDPSLNERIASLAFQLKDYKTAAEYWNKNLKEKNAFRDKAILGLVQNALEQGSRQNLLSLLNDFLAVTQFPIEEELAACLRFLHRTSGADALLYDLSLDYLRRYPQGRYADEALFFLAQAYEYYPPQRNFIKARECYQRLIKEYPESSYFTKAKERIAYIDRHYLKVQ